MSRTERVARVPGWRVAVLVAVGTLLAGSLASASPASAIALWRSPKPFAVVDATGTLVSGNEVAGVTYLGPGQYEVEFTRPVDRCAYIATTTNAYSQAIIAYTAGGHLSNRGVYVETKNQGGGLTDGPFNLVVACTSAGTLQAVVGYSADLVRSTPGTSLTPLGSGRYQVRFAVPVAGCAFLATVGDPGNELVFNPSGVYTGSGADRHSVYIETKNPGGGLQDGVPFHLAALCKSAPKTHVAVVNGDGTPARASSLTSSFSSALGQYAVVTSGPTSRCATVVTRGSVDTGVPFFPTTVEVVPGPAPNTVGVQMRNLLFFGDTPFGDAFHAAVVCGPATSTP